MAFKDRLKEARLNNAMTQEQVAEKIGVAKSTFTGYEKGNSEPNMFTISKIMNVLKVDANYLWQDEMDALGGNPMTLKYDEMKHIEKYRSLDPYGQETVSYILNRELKRTEQLHQANNTGTTALTTNIIELPPVPGSSHLVEYYHNASAGGGIYIMGNEVADRIEIPNTPENQRVDYAIGVSGNSMEPDFYDGDIALVSQKAELNHGDVGIFIINGNAYIKEYGETELISRNHEVGNIKISEYDNIVCMGKVIGKL